MRKSVSGFKDKTVSLLWTNTPKQTVYGKGQTLSKPRKQNIKKSFILEENKKKNDDRIRNIRIFLKQKKKKKEKSKNVMKD